MSNALLAYVNHVDGAGAVRSASSSAGDLSPEGLANPIVGRRWRTTDLSGWAQVDFGADKTLEVLALVFPRDTMGALAGTVQHLLDADGGTAGAGAAYDSGAVAIGSVEGYGYHVHVLASPVTARTWRFQFAASGVTYVDVGRAWAGPKVPLGRNFDYGLDDTWSDLSTVAISGRSGAEFADERARQRTIAFALNNMGTADRNAVRELRRVVGISRQVLFQKDPADTTGKEAILGRLAETNPITHRAFPVHATTFRIRESL